MEKVVRLGLRGLAALAAFCVVASFAAYSGIALFFISASLFPPLEGYPSADPHGRGQMAAVALMPSIFICAILGLVGAWLAWLATNRRNWSLDLAIAAPLFLLFAAITTANYVSFDIIYTRDSQALVNILLAASGATIVFMLQKSLKGVKSTFFKVLAGCVLAVTIFAFVALPLWYSISFLSWKLGAGKLDSLDSVAKAIGAAGSLLAAVGLSWEGGRLSLRRPAPEGQGHA